MDVSDVAALFSETLSGADTAPKLLVTLATYNEADNIRPLIQTIREFAPQASILVIDDNSPDGTGRIVEDLKKELPGIHIIHRAGKLGLGTATIEAMKYAIDHEYDLLLNLDGDFSHPPRFIPSILAGMKNHDVMIGSRYVPGGGVEGEFNLKRKFMSTGINWYARLFLGLSSKDNSGAFRCYRVSKLADIDFDLVRSRGYSFQEEILYWCRTVGCRIGETPILFENRRAGVSKINKREAIDALTIIFRLGLSRVFGGGKASERTHTGKVRRTLDPTLPPLRFEPILKRYLWGGRKLGTYLHKSIGEALDYAESWEISDREEDVSRVADGPLAGKSLRELIRTNREALLGSAFREVTEFPLLVKFIDAHQTLSVQVHPNDEQARRIDQDHGKTEAWVVLDCDPGSIIYAGLNHGVTREELEAAIEDGSVEKLLHAIYPNPGDCILIPAGTVHAIGAGVLLAEIQQMSDSTFRLFDWNRTGPDGKARPLHVQESLQVADFSVGPIELWKAKSTSLEGGGTREQLATSKYFAIERLRPISEVNVGCARRERFTILIVMAGNGSLQSPSGIIPIKQGQTFLLPASSGECKVIPQDSSGQLNILTCVVP